MMEHCVSLFYLLLGASAIALLYYFCRGSHCHGNNNDNAVSQRSNAPLTCSNDSSVHPISVVIPTLHEDAILPATISKLFTGCALPCPEPFVIVVDAGPTAETKACLTPLLADHPTLCLVSYPGLPSRGHQQNLGAAQAAALAPTAPIFLFLHADTLLPPRWDEALVSALSSSAADRPPAVGAFSLSLPESISPSLRVMLWGANLRAQWGGLPYGDQGYFLTRRTFESVGGFPEVPIMEDVELLKQIRKGVKGRRLTVLDEPVVTSPRRWNRKGVVWNTILNQVLMGCWLCGVSHETIYRWYYGRYPSQGIQQGSGGGETQSGRIDGICNSKLNC